MKIKTIFIGRRPARATPRNQGGGRAKRLSCQGLIEAGGGEMNRALKFGGLMKYWEPYFSSHSCMFSLLAMFSSLCLNFSLILKFNSCSP
jgi:hypothetical protein